MLGIDIRDSTDPKRDDSLLPELRSAWQRMLRDALARHGVGPKDYAQRSRGDGGRYDFAPGVSPVPVIEAVTVSIPSLLRAHNKRVSSGLRLELRFVVHGGYLVPTPDGADADGADVTLLHRMLDCGRLRTALGKSAAPWVLAVSEPVWRGVVRHGHGELEPENYAPLTLTHKSGETPAWITPEPRERGVPGAEETAAGAEGSALPPQEDRVGRAPAAATEAKGEVRDSVVFNGTVHAQNIVGRDDRRRG
ncbi:hypothetical protein [Streptomyces phaeochromogenes]|uniref:hypothetical protein n=1 Tax=Streptomyces phaeochromogenes TaxID=1923 RepID=UPI00369C0155